MRETIKTCLEQIVEQNGGRLTPDLVIEAARNPESPLHTEFNWNVDEAAMSHWRLRARQIISSVMVSITTEKSTVSCVAYVRDPDALYGEQGYVPVASLVSESDRAATAMLYEISRLTSTLVRVEHLAEALLVEQDVVKVRKAVNRLQTRVQSRLPASVA